MLLDGRICADDSCIRCDDPEHVRKEDRTVATRSYLLIASQLCLVSTKQVRDGLPTRHGCRSPDLRERQSGTVREDYSADGNAWGASDYHGLILRAVPGG